jgi:flavorubredoxin
VKAFDLSVSDIGRLAIELVDAATLVIATPAVLGGAHPAAIFAAVLANALHPKVKHIGLIGSYSWGQRITEQLLGMIPALANTEKLPPLMVEGAPGPTAFDALEQMADAIATRHQTLIPVPA